MYPHELTPVRVVEATTSVWPPYKEYNSRCRICRHEKRIHLAPISTAMPTCDQMHKTNNKDFPYVRCGGALELCDLQQGQFDINTERDSRERAQEALKDWPP